MYMADKFDGELGCLQCFSVFFMFVSWEHLQHLVDAIFVSVFVVAFVFYVLNNCSFGLVVLVCVVAWAASRYILRSYIWCDV